MTDYGSGEGADWTQYGYTISTPTQIVAADVWVFGDSILRANADDLTVALEGLGLAVAVNAWSSRPTTPAVDALEAWVGEYGAPPRLVMACGTNDIFDPSMFGPQVDRVLGLVDVGTPVIWVQPFAARPAYLAADQRNSGWMSLQLDATPVTVVRWWEYMATDPGRVGALLADGVHTNDDGRATWCSLITNGVQATMNPPPTVEATALDNLTRAHAGLAARVDVLSQDVGWLRAYLFGEWDDFDAGYVAATWDAFDAAWSGFDWDDFDRTDWRAS